MPYHPFYHGGGSWLGGLFALLIVVAVVAGAYLVAREVLHHRQASRPAPPPSFLTRAVEELDMRYARGELDRAEWVQRRADLLQGPGATPPAHPAPPPGPGPAAPPPPPPPA